ncbi:MAG TPA: hypothetical protein VHQ65_13945 [Thermoanaerobaculia bacterium]|nr:hypothetical protein [Thermoanaerobaculia bacterium]
MIRTSPRRPSMPLSRVALLCLLLAALPSAPVSAQGQQEDQVFFFKSFSPQTIAPGGVATLVFEIASEEEVPVTDLAFTDMLPAGVVIATPPSLSNGCEGSVSASPGSSVVSLSGGRMAAAGFCQITVDVTSDVPGTHTNVTSELTHSLGTTRPTEADLVVDPTRPGFTKSFAPDAVRVGETSTITFTLTNELEVVVTGATFTDSLPAGLVVADPANGDTDCLDAVLTADPGAGSITFDGAVPAEGSCTVTVDVRALTPGDKVNRTSDLTSRSGSSGRALAQLAVSSGDLLLSKELVDDPAVPGGTATLELTVRNLNRFDTAENIAFTDDLDAALADLVATGLPAAGVCGPGSTLSGASVITLAGGSLAPGDACTFQVVLAVPVDAAVGDHLNTTSEVTGDVGGRAVAGDAASDTLRVEAQPLITKDIVEPTAAGGGTLTLDFTITNTSSTDSAEEVVFSDLVEFVPGATVDTLPAPGFCGAGSQLRVVATASGDAIMLGANPGEEGTLAPGASCDFTVVLQLPATIAPETYVNTTSGVTAVVGGQVFTGPPASDQVGGVGPPALSKGFLDDPVLPGETVELRFVLTLSEDAPGAATGITFTDDLDATLAGLVATGLPAAEVCGTGSQLSGTSVLTLTGGTLAPGESCTFTVTLQVPAGAADGIYPNTTSTVTATMLGEAVTGPPATDDLDVAALELTKEFLAPAVSGGTTTLRFTITNDGAEAATDVAFTDDLDAVLPGVVALGLPVADACGAGSTVSGSDVIALTDGSLAAGTSCTVDVVVQVPAGASAGEYLNVTSQLGATIGGSAVMVARADDDLVVLRPLAFTKSFVDDPVQPGDTVTLRFTITNDHPTEAATDLAFDDDLAAVLPGLEAVGLPLSDVCGAGSMLTGTSVITLTGGTVAGGGLCTFDVTLQVPGSVSGGSGLVNTTSPLTGTVGGAASEAPAASDTLRLAVVRFEKSFGAATGAGGTVVLTFTLTNNSTDEAISGLSFLDDLEAMLPGLAAVGLPASDVCGAGSQITGTSVLTFSGGSLGPGEACSFDVTLSVPADAVPGDYVNTTSNLLTGGLLAGEPATAALALELAPAFSKAFAPASVLLGEVSTLTFTIDNSASTSAATGLEFSDVLPTGLVVAPMPNAAATCTGGLVTAVSGSSMVAYTGGSVAAGATCTVVVDVLPTVEGSLVNTSDALTSSLGSSGTATATLAVGIVAPPVTEIPTLSWPALLLLGGLLTLLAWGRLRV